jgi:hypothetical protein
VKDRTSVSRSAWRLSAMGAASPAPHTHACTQPRRPASPATRAGRPRAP